MIFINIKKGDTSKTGWLLTVLNAIFFLFVCRQKRSKKRKLDDG